MIIAPAFLCGTGPVTLPAQTGRQLFESTCAGCHGLDGRGGEHAPNIVTSARVQSLSGSGLTGIIHDGIPGSGMPAFGSVFQSRQIDAIVAYLQRLQGKQESSTNSGDADAGRTLFFGSAQCSMCHSVKGKGGFIAVDLSGYGRTHSLDEFRQQILEHNEENRRKATRVVVRGGGEYEGLIRNEDNFFLYLQTFAGDFLFLKKNNLTSIERKELTLLSTKDAIRFNLKDYENLMSYFLRNSERESFAPKVGKN